MKKIIKYFEFFDTEDIKTSHEIDLLKKTITKSSVVKEFEKQSPFQPVYGTLIYRFKFFEEAAKPSQYAFLSESLTSPKIFLINFKNEQAHVIIGFELLDNKKYNINITYLPNGIDYNINSNWINVMGELLEIKRNKIVNQEFKNLDINGVIRKINNVMIPIMKEFGFNNLIDSYKSDYDTSKN
mgnify:CR=1 FL=1